MNFRSNITCINCSNVNVYVSTTNGGMGGNNRRERIHERDARDDGVRQVVNGEITRDDNASSQGGREIFHYNTAQDSISLDISIRNVVSEADRSISLECENYARQVTQEVAPMFDGERVYYDTAVTFYPVSNQTIIICGTAATCREGHERAPSQSNTDIASAACESTASQNTTIPSTTCEGNTIQSTTLDAARESTASHQNTTTAGGTLQGTASQNFTTAGVDRERTDNHQNTCNPDDAREKDAGKNATTTTSGALHKINAFIQTTTSSPSVVHEDSNSEDARLNLASQNAVYNIALTRPTNKFTFLQKRDNVNSTGVNISKKNSNRHIITRSISKNCHSTPTNSKSNSRITRSSSTTGDATVSDAQGQKNDDKAMQTSKTNMNIGRSRLMKKKLNQKEIKK